MNMTSGMAYPSEDTPEVNALYEEAMAKATTPEELGTVEFMSRLAEAPLAFQPGASWRYGSSADVLGAVAEVASGMRFGEYLRKNFFEPLGMKDTGFYLPPEKKDRLAVIYHIAPGKPAEPYTGRHLVILDYDSEPAFQSGGAGLFSTADDYFRFAAMLGGEGSFGGRQYLRPETVRFMRTDCLTERQRPSFNWPQLRGYGYGNLVRVLLDPAAAGVISAPGEFGWDGWTGTFMEICPAERVQIILMTAHLDRDNTAVRKIIRNAIFRQYL
jgi:CubicO group peptidase (beta-lactamase class C family)